VNKLRIPPEIINDIKEELRSGMSVGSPSLMNAAMEAYPDEPNDWLAVEQFADLIKTMNGTAEQNAIAQRYRDAVIAFKGQRQYWLALLNTLKRL